MERRKDGSKEGKTEGKVVGRKEERVFQRKNEVRFRGERWRGRRR